MLVAESRPRNLSWLHAGPLLFGDWGTSRLYVLGLAFYYTAHASVYYLAVMSLIMAAVAWGYSIVCRCFPDGGGVYSAARRISPLLSVIAATLLICDFIVTAALSAVEGFHYLGAASQPVVVGASIGTIGALGLVNWFGAKAAGRFGLAIAVAAILASMAIGLMCLPLLPKGLATASAHVPGLDSTWKMWESLVRIVLALSGVEAVASMTGLMKEPVARTAKRTIWPVLIEVVLLNLVFGIALNALPGRVETKTPDYITYETTMGLASDLPAPADASPALRNELEGVKEYRQTAVKQLAAHAATRLFGESAGDVMAVASGIVFGLLLLSAVNTAILAMVSVFYALAQDKELPRALTRLNYSGVPWVGLILACALPAGVLLFVHDDKALGELYAIGVVGAIAINMLCCAVNKQLPIKPWERGGLYAIGGIMSVVELTIIYAKPMATAFAGVMIAIVLVFRAVAHSIARSRKAPVPTPLDGWLAEVRERPVKLDTTRPRVMLAARGQEQAEYAVDLARRRGAVLFAIYVRTIRLMDVTPGQLPKIDDDPTAQRALGTVAVLAKQAGVAFQPIYVVSPDVSAEILDHTATFACDTLIMGKSQRSLFARKVAGDVVAQVAENLPDEVSLITRSAKLLPHERTPASGVESKE